MQNGGLKMVSLPIEMNELPMAGMPKLHVTLDPAGKGDQTCDAVDTPSDLLKRADRIRRHALYFLGDLFAVRLEKYADELEALADRLAGGKATRSTLGQSPLRVMPWPSAACDP
jgi:hypothetical protein